MPKVPSLSSNQLVKLLEKSGAVFVRQGSTDHAIFSRIIGVPANVCSKCLYRVIPGKVVKYIDSLVDPIFEAETKYIEKILPSPHVGIQFLALDRGVYFDNQ
jgi:hypothetical protein